MRMNRALTEAIRMERFSEIYDGLQKDRLSCEEAAVILGCSVRHFLRLRDRYDEEGAGGLKDRRVGQRRGISAGGRDEALCRHLCRSAQSAQASRQAHPKMPKGASSTWASADASASFPPAWRHCITPSRSSGAGTALLIP